MYCPNCGKKLRGSETFCTQCGTNVSPSSDELENLEKAPKKRQGNRIIHAPVVMLLVLFVLLSAVLGTLYFGKSKKNRLQEQLSLGERYLAELDYDRAITSFSEALEIEPKSEDALIGIAQSYEGRGMKSLKEEKPIAEVRRDLTSAKEYYEQAVTQHPKSERTQEVQNALAIVNETLSYHPEQKETYKLEGEAYSSTSLAKFSGRLVKQEVSPPFTDYTTHEDKDLVSYNENRDDGYSYCVWCKWGLQLEEPIQVESNGKVTTVEEIGLIFFDDIEYPALKENDSYYCEGIIQDFYQMELDSMHGKGDKTLVATEKNIDREGYWEGDSYYTSIHHYYPYGNYVLDLSEMKIIGGSENSRESADKKQQKEDSQDEEKGEDSTLTGWAGAKNSPSVSYDDAEFRFNYLLESPGKGKAELRGNYEIVGYQTTWQDGTESFSTSSSTQSYNFMAEDQSDLGLLYAAADDYDDDGTAELISFRTEAVTDNFGGQWVYLYGQLEKYGEESIVHEFGDKLTETAEISYVVVDHYLIKVTQNYGVGGSIWPLSETNTDEYELNYVESIEIQDLNDLSNIVFHSTREVGNYLPNDYNYILEMQGDLYYWNMNYSTSDSISLHQINDEGEMRTIIEDKLAEIVGESVVILSPLQWKNRWSALSFTKPSSVLQIRTDFDPVSVEEQENGSKRVGTSSFIVKTTVPAESAE